MTVRNTSPNQQRSLKPTVPNPIAYSASPSQLTLSSELPSTGLQNPYHHPYAYAPAPHNQAFAFPQQAHYPQSLQNQHSSAQQQAQQLPSPTNSRKRRASELGEPSLPGSASSSASAFAHPQGLLTGTGELDVGLGPSQVQLPSPVAKKGRTNTPWTPAEEQRLKNLREAGSSWSDIAKTFPTRTEGSVKKHWYKVRTAVPSPRSRPGRRQMLTIDRTCITRSSRKTRSAQILFALLRDAIR